MAHTGTLFAQSGTSRMITNIAVVKPVGSVVVLTLVGARDTGGNCIPPPTVMPLSYFTNRFSLHQYANDLGAINIQPGK